MMKALVLALAGCLLGGAAQAQESAAQYPSRPVTFVVPFAPGGSTGLIARIIGQKLEQRLGKPFIIDHRAGGGGVIGVTQVAHGTPDGYTIMMASSTALAINPNVRKSLPYDPRKDITPIALIARMPYVLVVNPDLPVHSVADLVKLARDKPGQLSFASVGPGTIHHLNAEMFKSMFGLDVVHVPYKGTAPALAGRGRRPCAVHVRRCAAGQGADRIRQGSRARRHHAWSACRRCRTCRRSPRRACRASTPRHGIRSRRPRACRRTSSTSSPSKFAR